MTSPRRMSTLSSITNNLVKYKGNNILDLENSLISKDLSIEKIERFEATVTESLGIPPNHYFGEQVYVRSILFKKGTVATGRVHAKRHVSILIAGHMTIWTPDRGVHDVFGPSITEVKPGMKRAGYAHTDVLWATAHGIKACHENAPESILEFLTFRYYGEYLDFINEHTIDVKIGECK